MRKYILAKYRKRKKPAFEDKLYANSKKKNYNRKLMTYDLFNL